MRKDQIRIGVGDLTIHRHQKLVRTIIRMHAELRVRRENEWPDRERVR